MSDVMFHWPFLSIHQCKWNAIDFIQKYKNKVSLLIDWKCVKKREESKLEEAFCSFLHWHDDGLAKMPVSLRAKESWATFHRTLDFCLGIGQTRIWLQFDYLLLGDLDEEDGCPPDLEAVEVQVQQQQQQQQQVQQQVQQQQQQSVENTLNQQEQLKKFLDSDLIRNLTIAIKVSKNYPFVQAQCNWVQFSRYFFKYKLWEES